MRLTFIPASLAVRFNSLAQTRVFPKVAVPYGPSDTPYTLSRLPKPYHLHGALSHVRALGRPLPGWDEEEPSRKPPTPMLRQARRQPLARRRPLGVGQRDRALCCRPGAGRGGEQGCREASQRGECLSRHVHNPGPSLSMLAENRGVDVDGYRYSKHPSLRSRSRME